jgi:hypothetical protein
MKVGVGNGNVVGNDGTLTDDNSIRTHKDWTDEYGIVADLDHASGLDIKRGPSVHLHSVSDDEAGLPLASEAAKAIASFKVAFTTDADIGWQVFVAPLAGNLIDVHFSNPNRCHSGV